MLMRLQAEKRVATRRPREKTRKNWLNLLNFMRFLRRGPIRCEPRENRLSCPVGIVKAQYGGLLKSGRAIDSYGVTLCGTAATAVGRALEVYGECCVLMSEPVVVFISKLETVPLAPLLRKLTVKTKCEAPGSMPMATGSMPAA